MRKLVSSLVALLVVAWTAQAGGPPDRGRQRDRGRRGRDRGRRGVPMMGERREDTDIFNVAQRYVQLTDEQRAALEKLDGQCGAEERAAMAEVRAKLEAKYIALILEALPDEDKQKLQKVFAARAERDDAIAAARKTFLDAMTKLEERDEVEATRDPDYVPYGKLDLVRRFLKLTEQQRTALDEVRRGASNTMRERMRQVRRPQDWRNAEARRQFAAAARKVRDEVDAEVVVKMVEHLTDAQKDAYAGASEALDAYRQKTKEAEEAYTKKLTQLGVRPTAPAPAAGGARTEF